MKRSLQPILGTLILPFFSCYGYVEDHITDGIRWLIDQKLVDQDRIAIVGGSYDWHHGSIQVTGGPKDQT